MDNTREKLIELILETDLGLSSGREMDANNIAYHLVTNGVTLDNQVSSSKWIPVTERLPEEDGRYLCNTRSFAFPGSFYQTITKYDKGGFIDGYIYTDDVTHWMPLPEAPKEE